MVSIPTWAQINKALGLGEPISTKRPATHGVVSGDTYDSHIQEYYYQQEGMVKEESTNSIGNMIVIGAVILSGVYLLKKMKGK